ncbi:MAG: hypothetical protein L6V84_03855 [Oscillospiraceae bacterium]|nr:MAG: hypothetical protein L6V84_03855 [Oscillospiraceae bacterium]
MDAYEYEAGRGVVAGEESLRAVGEAAAAHGIRMSLHAPYFISLSGAVEEKAAGKHRLYPEIALGGGAAGRGYNRDSQRQRGQDEPRRSHAAVTATRWRA